MHHHGACMVLAQYTHTILRSAFGKSIETSWWIMQEERSESAAISLLWYYAPYCATVRRPWIQMMSNILLLPIAISTDRSTHWICALDTCNTARSFTHQSNTCLIRRLAFLNLGFIEQMSCTPLSTTTSGLAFGEPQRSGDFRKKNVFRRRKNRNLSLRCGSPNASLEVVHRPRSWSPLHLIVGTYNKFARENNFLSLGVWFLQFCSNADRMFAASRSHLQNYRRIVSFTQQNFRWNTL